jgi:hypothetical protein
VRSSDEATVHASTFVTVTPRTAYATPPASPRSATPSEGGSLDGNAAPTIHVTIGRIDVRAVSPPSAPAAAEAPRLRLTLDRFLDQRSGGSR